MKEKRTIRVQTLILMVMAGLALVGGIVLLRWAYQPSTILEVKNSPVPVQPPEINVGGKVFLTIDFCKKGNYTDKTDVKLVGEQGAKIDVNWPTGRTPEQCSKLNEVPMAIPGQTPTDTYRAMFTVCYDVNPIKKNRCTVFESQPFKVVNSKLSPGDAKVDSEPR